MAIIREKNAVTIIELIVTITILGILAISAGVFFIPMMSLFFYLPSQLAVENTADSITDIIIEGDNNAEGLRYAKSITSADEDDITFVTEEDDTVRFRWDATTSRIYRNINSQGEQLVPFRYFGGITVKGKNADSEIFQYYNSSATKLAVPVATTANIESIRINIVVQDGDGNIKNNRGKTELYTAVDIKTY